MSTAQVIANRRDTFRQLVDAVVAKARLDLEAVAGSIELVAEFETADRAAIAKQAGDEWSQEQRDAVKEEIRTELRKQLDIIRGIGE